MVNAGDKQRVRASGKHRETSEVRTGKHYQLMGSMEPYCSGMEGIRRNTLNRRSTARTGPLSRQEPVCVPRMAAGRMPQERPSWEQGSIHVPRLSKSMTPSSKQHLHCDTRKPLGI